MLSTLQVDAHAIIIIIVCYHFNPCKKDRICNFNRHYAEYAGYWQTTDFLKTLDQMEQPIKFYDSVTGKLLFTAPIGRSMEDFVKESLSQ